MNQEFDFLNSFSNICDETYQKLTEISQFNKVKAGTHVVKLGEVPNSVYLLVSGVVRCYLVTEDGKEFNKSFYLPRSFFAPFTALLSRKQSIFAFESLTDCSFYAIDYCKFIKMTKESLALNNLYSKVLEMVYLKYENRLIELISLDATKRYFELKNQIPNLDKRIPQYHIASYLGITAVQLSRIRKKIDGD